MDIILKGVAFGTGLAIIIGPVFFSLVQTSLESGFISGIFMAVGISLSDLTYVILSYLGISQLAQHENFSFYPALLGGLILIAFGIASFFKGRYRGKVNQTKKNGKDVFKQIIKGFLINGVNPFALIFWIGAMSLATVEYGYSGNQLRIFFTAVLCTVFFTDVAKSYLSNKLKQIINFRFVKIMNNIVGVVLVAFGIRLLYLALTQNISLSIP
jgi:threonine/homoserine/homoserine lactone efflux protein